jgi:predicted dehydrogenase
VKRFTAAVIGLGRIGQGFDYDQHGSSVIATHASAYTQHHGFELCAGVDPDPAQRKRFESKFNQPAYIDLKSMMAHYKPEVLSIAVPVEQHLPVFQDIVHHNPRAVICEKPIASSAAEGRLMQSLAEAHKCALVVNYMRRFEPGSIALKEIVRNGKVGKIFKGVVWYSKGLINNGSHFLDLLHFWLGDVTRVEVMQKGRRWDDIDPEPDVCLHFDQAAIYFLAGREECFSIGEMDLFGSSGRIRYTEFGKLIELCRTSPDPVFEGYTILGQDKEIIPTDLKRYQWHVLEGLYNHLTRNTELVSNGSSATKTLEVMELICSRMKGGCDE